MYYNNMYMHFYMLTIDRKNEAKKRSKKKQGVKTTSVRCTFKVQTL